MFWCHLKEKDSREYLRQNVARVRDIELLTGLTFFPGVDVPSARIKLTTYLPEQPWSTLPWTDVDGECPIIDENDPNNCPAGYVS